MQCCHCSRAAAATSGLWPCTLSECSWDPKGWFQPKELEGRVLSALDIRTLMVSTLVWMLTLVTNGFAPTLPLLFHMQFTMAWSGLSGWVRIKVKDWNSIQQSCPFPVSLISVGNCSVFVIEVSVTLEQWLSYSACVNGRFISVDSFSLWVVGPVALSEAVHRGKTVWKSRIAHLWLRRDREEAKVVSIQRCLREHLKISCWALLFKSFTPPYRAMLGSYCDHWLSGTLKIQSI